MTKFKIGELVGKATLITNYLSCCWEMLVYLYFRAAMIDQTSVYVILRQSVYFLVKVFLAVLQKIIHHFDGKCFHEFI